jgi:hypothetical protein
VGIADVPVDSMIAQEWLATDVYNWFPASVGLSGNFFWGLLDFSIDLTLPAALWP